MYGIANLGNTCGVSALLQCLFHARGLRGALLKAGSGEDGLVVNLREAMAALTGHAAAPPGTFVRPDQLVRELHERSKGMFPRGQQHDLCELWVWLVEHVHEATGVVQASPAGDPSAVVPMAAKVRAALHAFQKGKYSDVLAEVQGAQVVMVRCDACGHHTANIEPITVLALDLPPEAPDDVPVALTDLVKAYLGKESLGDYKCDACGALGAHKLCRFWSLPDTLVVVVKRFDGRMRKKRTPLHLSEWITLHPPTVLGERQPASFRLRCVGNHRGSCGGGHYTAHVRYDRGEEGAGADGAHEGWTLLDDEAVARVADAGEVYEANRDCYLLIYERVW